MKIAIRLENGKPVEAIMDVEELPIGFDELWTMEQFVDYQKEFMSVEPETVNQNEQ